MENRRRKQKWVARLGGVAVLGIMVQAGWASDPFGPPKPDELAMKSLEGHPGAAAVILYREEIDDSVALSIQRYDRIKILSEEGKKYANIELGYVSTSFFSGDPGVEIRLSDVAGRTIHADGKIIPFTGKPYEADVEKMKGVKVKAKVFTLPDVEVGSIIEYRYTKHFASMDSPDWYVQGALYIKSAKYRWTGNRYATAGIAWFPVLPPGTKVNVDKDKNFELVVSDIPPLPDADFLPPSASFVYRVQFNYIIAKTGDEFWKTRGDFWSRDADSFMEVNPRVNSLTATVIAGATTQEQKLRKIYDFVAGFENTNYVRERGEREQKAAGQHEIKHVVDILDNKRGNSFALTTAFVAMARAAGMKAYLVLVPDRTEDLFSRSWLSFQQFDGVIAIVNIDGKDEFFDPGTADCPYGQVSWQYTLLTGLRQTDSGSSLVQTPGPVYSQNRVTRTANLTMDETGQVSGKIDLTFQGAQAMRWRHEAREGDDASLRHSLEKTLRDELPKTLDVKVSNIEKLNDRDQPLAVSFEVHGTLAAKAGRRMLVPVDLFVSQETATFADPKRDLAVYFHYPELVEDAVKVSVPQTVKIEAAPDDSKLSIPGHAEYRLSTTSEANSFTTKRTFASGHVIVLPAKYDELRDFYRQFEAKDQGSVVLKTGS